MPKVIKTGHYNVFEDLTQANFWSITANINGTQRSLTIFVSDEKYLKHAIGSYWPPVGQQQGRQQVGQQQGARQQRPRHTGVTIDEDQFEPFYKHVAIDLAAEYLKRGGAPIWIELEYGEEELPDQYFGADVITKSFMKIQKLIVGGSVGSGQNAGVHVYINHGPYRGF
jgi:hypothetical protein